MQNIVVMKFHESIDSFYLNHSHQVLVVIIQS